MEVYTLIVYFIHGKCAHITLSHHLRLKVQCDFTYAIKGFFSCKVDCNYFLITIVVTNWHLSTSACASQKWKQMSLQFNLVMSHSST